MGMLTKLAATFRRPWSDDLRVEVRAHNGRTWFATHEYDDVTWSTGPGRKQTEYAQTGRHPAGRGDLPHDKDAAISAAEAAVSAAGYNCGPWFVQCGLGRVPLDEWLAEHGAWGHYTVTEASITRAA